MAVAVAWGKEVVVDHILDQAEGLVVALALFVLDHPPLVIELLLGDGPQQVAHAIAFQEQGPVEGTDRDGLEIVGPIEPGGPVEVRGAHFLQRLEEVARGVFRAVEHQMLEEVGEARATRRFVLRADAVPDRDRDHRCLAIRVHEHPQTVGQGEALVGNVHQAGQFRRRSGLAGGGGGAGRRRGGGRCRGEGDEKGEAGAREKPSGRGHENSGVRADQGFDRIVTKG